MTEASSSSQRSAMPVAPGKGKTRERLEREAAARRAIFAVSLAGFVGFFGLVATAGKPAPPLRSELPAPASELTDANRVIAEIPVSGLNGDTTETIIRIVAPGSQAPTAHVRTRAS